MMLYIPGPQLFATDWLSRNNHETGRDEEIPGMYITVNAIESFMAIPDCMRAEERRIANLDDENLGILSEHVLFS